MSVDGTPMRQQNTVARYWFVAVAICAILLSTLPTWSQTYADLSLSMPFPTDRSLDRLQERFPGAGDGGTRSVLKTINFIRYSFSDLIQKCPYETYCGNIQDPSIHYRIVHRTTDIQINQIGDAINSAIQSYAFDDGCSSLRFPAFRFLSSDQTTIVYTVEIRVLIRYCHDTIFGEVKTDLAGGWFQLYIPISLSKTGPALSGASWNPGNFAIQLGYPYLHIYEINNHIPTLDIDGIVRQAQANLNSLVAAFDASRFNQIRAGLNAFLNWLNNDSLQSIIPYVLLPQQRFVRKRVAKYLRQLPEIRAFLFKQSLDVGATIFVGGSLLELSYFTVVPDDLLPDIYMLKQKELEYFASLDHDPQSITVARGDSIWKLAKKYYGVGDLWYLIAEENGFRNDRDLVLHPGSLLTLPPYWKIAQRDACAVRVGETVWSRVKKTRATKFELRKLRPPLGSLDLDHIYPLQCIAV
jgi:hypothetical protein